jgi:hypothetical protein
MAEFKDTLKQAREQNDWDAAEQLIDKMAGLLGSEDETEKRQREVGKKIAERHNALQNGVGGIKV